MHLSIFLLVLSLGQFARFMSVIQKLGQRVEKEHTQYLRDHQRLDDRSSLSPGPSMTPDLASNISFEQLVHRKGVHSTSGANSPSWDDDVWGKIINDSNQVS
jgi:SCY1-like protein 2